MQLVDKMHLPCAKTISVLALLPFVMFYTKLLEQTSRERMLIILPAFYAITILCFSAVIGIAHAAPEMIAARSIIPYTPSKVLEYFWYLLVESFGSLVFALFRLLPPIRQDQILPKEDVA